MRLITTSNTSFFVDKITIVEVLRFLLPTVKSFEVKGLNSVEGENYYYANDIKDVKSVQRVIDFFESKEKLFTDTFSINIDGVLFDFNDNYSFSIYCEDFSKIEVFTKKFCSEFLKYNDGLIKKILQLDGKYALVDLGIIVREFLTFDDYLDDEN